MSNSIENKIRIEIRTAIKLFLWAALCACSFTLCYYTANKPEVFEDNYSNNQNRNATEINSKNNLSEEKDRDESIYNNKNEIVSENLDNPSNDSTRVILGKAPELEYKGVSQKTYNLGDASKYDKGFLPSAYDEPQIAIKSWRANEFKKDIIEKFILSLISFTILLIGGRYVMLFIARLSIDKTEKQN